MSVIHFSAGELANLAVSAVGGSIASEIWESDRFPGMSKSWHGSPLQTGRPMSIATATGGCDLVTADDIRGAIGSYNKRPDAIRTLGGLAYNAVSQKGTDFLDEATAKGLLAMATRFLS